jgi:hypothetical protein
VKNVWVFRDVTLKEARASEGDIAVLLMRTHALDVMSNDSNETSA